MSIDPTLAWLVDEAAEAAGAGALLTALGDRLVGDGLPLAGGALTLAVPHPLIARRTWLWRAETGEVIEGLGFASAGPRRRIREGCGAALAGRNRGGRAARGQGRAALGRAVARLDRGASVHAGRGPRPPRSRSVRGGAARGARREGDLGGCALRPTSAAAARRACCMRRSGGPRAKPLPRRSSMRTCAAFTLLSETHPPGEVIEALNAWFDRVAGAVHAFGGEVLKFIGDGILAIFPVAEDGRRAACDAALRAASAARAGMAHLDEERREQGLPSLAFGLALHLGEIFWGNVGAADRLDFTAIGPLSIWSAASKACASRLGKPCSCRGPSPPRPTFRSYRSAALNCGGSRRPARCLRRRGVVRIPDLRAVRLHKRAGSPGVLGRQ